MMPLKKQTTGAPRSKKKPAKAQLPEPTTPLVHSFESPESSTIARAEFTPSNIDDTGRLLVQFKRDHGLDTYVYMGVPAALWVAFSVAQSKGRYFQMAIRPLYAGRRLE